MKRQSRVILKRSSAAKYRKINRHRMIKKLFFPAMIFIALAGVSYFFVFSSFFRVENIVANIDGGSDIESAAAREAIIKKLAESSFIPKNNWFFIDERDIIGDIQKQFPGYASLRLIKRLPNSLELIAEKRKADVIYCAGKDRQNQTDAEAMPNTEKCFYMDREGVIFAEAPRLGGLSMLIVKDTHGRTNSRPGETAIGKDIFDKLILIKDFLAGEVGINAREIDLRDVGDVAVFSDKNYKIYLNLNNNIQIQILSLKEILAAKINVEDQAKLDYIDLRMEGRAYYK